MMTNMNCMWKEKSDYFKGLEKEDQTSYIKKLTLNSGFLLPDPCNIKQSDWRSEESLLPDISFPDISFYLIETPSEYTRDKIRAYKSLEAYNFFVSGHVQDLSIYYVRDTKFLFIKSEVLPSQRQGQKQTLYAAWIALHKTGWILSANCTCMAGLGSACSHVAAVLFKLQAASQMDLNKVACTSKLCSWKKSRKRAFPGPLKNLSFKRPKKSDTVPNTDGPFEGELEGFCSSDPVKFCTSKQLEMLQSLKEIAPNAAVLTCVSLDLSHHNTEEPSADSERTETADSERTDTAIEDDENTLPEIFTSFFDPCSTNYDTNKLTSICTNRYKKYCNDTSKTQYKNLESITKTQSSTDKWMLYRAGRITSSNCKKAFTMDINKPAESTIKLIMQYNDHITTKAMAHGKSSEPIAFNAYKEIQKKTHIDFEVDNSGLCVNAEYHFLGASPDGVTNCTCHGKGLLEIKCPFSFKTGLAGYKESKNCPINKDDSINTKHEYYFQMQLQMLVTETNFCDFFVWTEGKKENDYILMRVKKDASLIENMLVKFSDVFQKVLLPELVTRDKDPNNKKETKVYCYCKRPHFNPMIGCDNPKCAIQWFHYSCVNLVRTPQTEKWFCPDCTNTSLKKYKQ